MDERRPLLERKPKEQAPWGSGELKSMHLGVPVDVVYLWGETGGEKGDGEEVQEWTRPVCGTGMSGGRRLKLLHCCLSGLIQLVQCWAKGLPSRVLEAPSLSHRCTTLYLDSSFLGIEVRVT